MSMSEASVFLRRASLFLFSSSSTRVDVMEYIFPKNSSGFPSGLSDGKPDEFFGKIYSITSTLVELDENKKRLALLKKTDASDIDIVAVTKELDEWVGDGAELQSKHPIELDHISEKVGKDPDPQRSINELIRKYEKADPETRGLMRRVSQMVLSGFEETLRR